MLAKNVNDNVGSLVLRGVLAFFASKLAPTLLPQSCCNQCSAQKGAEVNLQGASLIYGSGRAIYQGRVPCLCSSVQSQRG